MVGEGRHQEYKSQQCAVVYGDVREETIRVQKVDCYFDIDRPRSCCLLPFRLRSSYVPVIVFSVLPAFSDVIIVTTKSRINAFIPLKKRSREREFTNKCSRTQITKPVFPTVSLFLFSYRSIEAICVSIGHQKIFNFFCFEHGLSLCASPSFPLFIRYTCLVHPLKLLPDFQTLVRASF